MNDDYEGTLKIRQALEQGSLGLDQRIAAKLEDARRLALDHQGISVKQVGFATAHASVGGSFGHVILPNLRMLMALMALTLGTVGTYYWNGFEQADENEEVDSALLADDLPVDAYTDQGFQAWLEHSAQSSGL